MATNQAATVPKIGFMDLPPEMRNQIYETSMSDTWDSPVITTEKLSCRSIFDLVLSLRLHRRFPLLATSKQAMYEALAFCLEKFTLRLENLDQLNAIRAVQHTSTFQQLGARIHSVALDMSWYGRGIDNFSITTTTTLTEPRPNPSSRCPACICAVLPTSSQT